MGVRVERRRIRRDGTTLRRPRAGAWAPGPEGRTGASPRPLLLGPKKQRWAAEYADTLLGDTTTNDEEVDVLCGDFAGKLGATSSTGIRIETVSKVKCVCVCVYVLLFCAGLTDCCICPWLAHAIKNACSAWTRL